jgi:hypothetical protein
MHESNSKEDYFTDNLNMNLVKPNSVPGFPAQTCASFFTERGMPRYYFCAVKKVHEFAQLASLVCLISSNTSMCSIIFNLNINGSFSSPSNSTATTDNATAIHEDGALFDTPCAKYCCPRVHFLTGGNNKSIKKKWRSTTTEETGLSYSKIPPLCQLVNAVTDLRL